MNIETSLRTSENEVEAAAILKEFRDNQKNIFLNTIPFDDCVEADLSRVDSENRAILEKWNGREDDFGFLFRGQVGTGKTYASVAFAKKIALELISTIVPRQEGFVNDIHPWLPKFVRASEIYEKTQRNDFQIPFKIKDTPILFLDDIGSENVTDFKRETLYNLFEYRLSKKLLTFVTTNLSLTQVKEIYFERVASRLLALCVPLEFKGEDRRMNMSVERLKRLKGRSKNA